MYIGLTEDQETLRSELRAYYDRLLTPAVREDAAREHGVGPKTKAIRAADGEGRLALLRLAEGVRRPGPRRGRSVHLLRRVDARRGAGADADGQHGRADDHALRNRRAEAVLPAEDRRRRDRLLHRLLASPTRAPTSRRSRPAPCATATTTWSTVRRSGPASRAAPTTAGSPCAPIRRRPSTPASRC